MENEKDVDVIQESNKRFANQKRREEYFDIPEEHISKLNTALDCEEDGEYGKAMDLLEEIYATESGNNNEKIAIAIARVYPKLLEKDISDCNQKYKEDLERYFVFLDKINMNDLMQEYVVETLANLCGLLENEWYRPLFKDFVERIEAKGYLKKDEYKRTIESALCSYESVLYYSDARISNMVRKILKSGYDRNFSKSELKTETAKKSLEVEIYTNDYYLCNFYEDNKELFDYIKETYPHSYALISPVIDKIIGNKENAENEIIDTLMNYVSAGTTIDSLRLAMKRSFENVLLEKKGPEVVHSGFSTYHRPTKKVGRNDLCPCGSGLKFKNCCGKQ